MAHGKIELMVSEDDEEVAYISLQTHPGSGVGVVKRTLDLHDLLGEYVGPDVMLDFDAAGVLIGIEILGYDSEPNIGFRDSALVNAMRRQRRIRGFEERASRNPAELVTTSDAGSYIAVHPMSDEEQLLESLGQKPEECVIVDCYWHVDGDVHFVQVHTVTSGQLSRGTGLYARREMSDGYAFNFVLGVDESMIRRATLEDGLRGALKVLRQGIDPGLSLSQIA